VISHQYRRSSGGQFVAVLHSGYSAHQVTIVDLLKGAAVSHAAIAQGFYGLEFSRDGSRLFCSGAGEELIHSFGFQNGNLTDHEKIQTARYQGTRDPSRLSHRPARSHDLCSECLGDRVTRIDLVPSRKPSTFFCEPTPATSEY